MGTRAGERQRARADFFEGSVIDELSVEGGGAVIHADGERILGPILIAPRHDGARSGEFVAHDGSAVPEVERAVLAKVDVPFIRGPDLLLVVAVDPGPVLNVQQTAGVH